MLRFAVSGHQGQFIYPPGYPAIVDKFTRLIDDVDYERLNEERYAQKLRELLRRHPWFLDGHVQMTSELIEMGEYEHARRFVLRGLDIAEKAVPENFDGQIPWSIIDNRAYLSLLDMLCECYTSLGEHDEACIAMMKLLKWNPNDNQGVRWRIGAELLRAERSTEAREALETYAEEYPPYHYELGLLLYCEGKYSEAATSIRRGFARNTYVAELLGGPQMVPPRTLPIWHASNLEGPELAYDYLEHYGNLWAATEFALDFVRWLFHHPKIMLERARLIEIRESLQWESPGSVRNQLIDRQREAEAQIDDAFSQTLIVRRTDSRGVSGYPWQYPFDQDAHR